MATHSIRGIGSLDPSSVEQEPNTIGRLALTITKGVHQLLELGGPLDLEKHLVVTVGDLDVEVLGTLGGLRLASGVGISGFRHREGVVDEGWRQGVVVV